MSKPNRAKDKYKNVHQYLLNNWIGFSSKVKKHNLGRYVVLNVVKNLVASHFLALNALVGNGMHQLFRFISLSIFQFKPVRVDVIEKF